MRVRPPQVRSRRGPLIAVAVVVLVIAAAIGAWLDWVWWEVYSGVVITLGAAVLIVVAIVLLIPRASRPVGFLVGAAAVGLLVGQNFGPSRSPLTVAEGAIELAISSPVTADGTAPATCSVSEDGRDLSIGGDPNLRLAVLPDDPNAPSDVDQREFVGVSFSIGDRWDPVATRDDRSELRLLIGRVEADAGETWLISDASSTLDGVWDASGGSVTFAGLVPDTREPGTTGDALDLEGTLTWTCASPS